MKKIIAILSVALFLFATVSGCQQSKDKSEQTETTESNDSTSNDMMAKAQYTCTMHPEILQNEPGKCPKCGMDLVKKEGDAHDSTAHDH